MNVTCLLHSANKEAASTMYPIFSNLIRASFCRFLKRKKKS